MHTRQDILSFLRDNKEYLRTHFHLTKVGIFGSFAQNEQKQDSDIDILIEMEEETKNIFDLKYELRDFSKSNLTGR